MAILKNPNKEKFTVIDNFALRDNGLSLKARGLLVTMLSLPDNWKFSENGLCSILPKDGQASIRSGLKELEALGYLSRQRTRDEHGRVSEVVWEICDYPRLENPSVDNPNLENRPQLNTKERSTKERNTEIGTHTRFYPPSVDEVRSYCRERQNNIDPEAFVDYYEANGWVQGRGKPIRDWKAAVRTWERRRKESEKKESGDGPERLITLADIPRP